MTNSLIEELPKIIKRGEYTRSCEEKKNEKAANWNTNI
jgi:hypothetical protein